MMKTTTTVAAAEATTAAAMTVTATCFSSNLQSPPNLQNRRDCSSCFCVWRCCYFAIGLFSDGDGGGHKFASMYFVKKLSSTLFICWTFHVLHVLRYIACSRAPHIFSLSVSLTLESSAFAHTLIGASAFACVRVRTCAYVCALCCSNSNGSAFSTSLAYAYSHPYNSLVAIAIQIKDDTQRQTSIPFHSIRFDSFRFALHTDRCRHPFMPVCDITCVHFSKSTILFLFPSLVSVRLFEPLFVFPLFPLDDSNYDDSDKMLCYMTLLLLLLRLLQPLPMCS